MLSITKCFSKATMLSQVTKIFIYHNACTGHNASTGHNAFHIPHQKALLKYLNMLQGFYIPKCFSQAMMLFICHNAFTGHNALHIPHQKVLLKSLNMPQGCYRPQCFSHARNALTGHNALHRPWCFLYARMLLQVTSLI